MNPIRHIELLALARLAEDVPLLGISFELKEDAQALIDLQLTVSDEILSTSVTGEKGIWHNVTVNTRKVLELVKDSEKFRMTNRTLD